MRPGQCADHPDQLGHAAQRVEQHHSRRRGVEPDGVADARVLRRVARQHDGQATVGDGLAAQGRVPPDDEILYSTTQPKTPYLVEKRILVSGNEPGKGVRLYVRDIASGKSQAITPEGVNGTAFVIAPDSQLVAGIGPDQKGYLYPVAGGEPRVIAGLSPGEQPITFSSDSRSLYVYQPGELPALVYRLDLQTGQRTLWKQLMPSDPAGVETIGPILITPDAKTCVFGYHRMLADLYLVEGLK